jgi:4'-phosphopantetheinyl transferase
MPARDPDAVPAQRSAPDSDGDAVPRQRYAPDSDGDVVPTGRIAPDREVDVVRVWRIGLDALSAAVNDLRPLLSPDERARAGRFVYPIDRARYVVAHAAVRLILSDHLSIPPDRLRWVRGPYGKPTLAGLPGAPHCNLSHSAGRALFALCRTRPVGVDIERVQPGIAAAALARRWYGAELPDRPPAMQARRFTTMWVRKEACVKACGARLAQGLHLPVTRGPVVHDPSGALPGPWRIRDLPVEPPYTAAVALAGEHPYRIDLRDWQLDLISLGDA